MDMISPHCNHAGITVPVENGAGIVIAYQCSLCLEALWAYGTCTGCGKAGQLPEMSARGLFCARDCQAGYEAAATKARAAKRRAFKAKQATIPGVDMGK